MRTGQTMTDLEAHVAAEGRSELVAQGRALIDRSASNTSTTSSSRSPAASSAKACRPITGNQLRARVSVGLRSDGQLFVDRHKNYIGYGPEASELVGIPDPETLVQLPWDKRVARVFCTCFRNREEASIRAAISPPTAAATYASFTTSSRKRTGSTSVTAPSRR